VATRPTSCAGGCLAAGTEIEPFERGVLIPEFVGGPRELHSTAGEDVAAIGK
jgi:hypothetical protein